MRQGEIEYRPNENYLSQQECITAQNRAVLLDWMMEVCAEYTLKRSTYYKAVNFVDRFLSVVNSYGMADIYEWGENKEIEILRNINTIHSIHFMIDHHLLLANCFILFPLFFFLV